MIGGGIPYIDRIGAREQPEMIGKVWRNMLDYLIEQSTAVSALWRSENFLEDGGEAIIKMLPRPSVAPPPRRILQRQ